MKPSDFIPREMPFRWYAELPRELGTFYGKTIGIELDRLLPHQLEHPSDSDMKLLGEILDSLPEILATAKFEFEKYELESDASFLDHLCNPQIWISCSEEGREDEWAFVVERSDWPDYGCHINFKGCVFTEIWGGD
jgi:hypothetical protein